MKDYTVLSEDGRFRSQNMLYLAEILEDYNPYLELRWIPPEHRVGTEATPYCIVHSSPGKREYIVKFISEVEAMNPQVILADIFLNDTTRNDVLARLDAEETAERAFRMKAWLDEQDERTDLVKFFMGERNYLRMRDYRGDKVVFDEHRRKRRA